MDIVTPALITQINLEVNKSITYKGELKGSDTWQQPSTTLELGTGDCEDYALLKMDMLKAEGIKSTLAFTYSNNTPTWC